MHFHYVVWVWNERTAERAATSPGSRPQHGISIRRFGHERAPSFRLAQNLQRPSNGKSG
jgi:hypothetical protein